MKGPHIEVDLSKIRDNTQMIVERLKVRGISATGVTKAVCGHPVIAQAMLDGGAVGLAEARLSNVQKLRKAGITCPITLIRTPMLSEVDQVVQSCEASYNTQMIVIAALAAAAVRRDKIHGIILMVEMGDLREGIMPRDLDEFAQQVVEMRGVALNGIGANFACLSGVAPDAAKMAAFSLLAKEIELKSGRILKTISGGNSANLPRVFKGNSVGHINNLRLGEAILLGVDPVSGNQLGGLRTDAFTLVAEVIEIDTKLGLSASVADSDFAHHSIAEHSGCRTRLIIAIGHQDTDVLGLSIPCGNSFIGATSDHLVITDNASSQSVGSKMRFQMNYSALMRAMAAPDINTMLLYGPRSHPARAPQCMGNRLAST